MNDAPTSNAQYYEIRLKGHLDPRWVNRFEGMNITQTESGETLLTGLVIDQAALHGLLKSVRDIGLPLISIGIVEPNPFDSRDGKP